MERRILSDNRDVGAVKRRQDADVWPDRGKHLACDPRARGVRDCVVHVQQIELVGEHHLVHAHGECEIVWRVLEQRIAADVHLVEVDPRQERRQPEGLLVGDEVDLMAAPR